MSPQVLGMLMKLDFPCAPTLEKWSPYVVLKLCTIWLDLNRALLWLASKPFCSKGYYLSHGWALIDLEVARFYKENQILLFCLPHSSHLIQPLDVSFFKPLKTAWGKAHEEFCLAHPGTTITKHVCGNVLSGVDFLCKDVDNVNGFQEAGICPLDPGAIPAAKLSPSQPFSTVLKLFYQHSKGNLS